MHTTLYLESSKLVTAIYLHLQSGAALVVELFISGCCGGSRVFLVVREAGTSAILAGDWTTMHNIPHLPDRRTTNTLLNTSEFSSEL